jgi:DNA-binding NtrC family response regulator
MSQCRLIVCEKSSHWASALRSALRYRPPQVVETRSLAGCEAALAESPSSLVAIEATANNLEALLGFITSVKQPFPRASVVVLLAPESLHAAPLLREAGAIDAITSVLQAPRAARLARRQLALAPKQEADVREFITQRMPWPAYATTEG